MLANNVAKGSFQIKEGALSSFRDRFKSIFHASMSFSSGVPALILSYAVFALFLAMGEFRNQIAHNPVMTLVKSKKGLPENSIGYEVFYKRYETFHRAYKLLEPMLNDLEKSLH